MTIVINDSPLMDAHNSQMLEHTARSDVVFTLLYFQDKNVVEQYLEAKDGVIHINLNKQIIVVAYGRILARQWMRI